MGTRRIVAVEGVELGPYPVELALAGERDFMRRVVGCGSVM